MRDEIEALESRSWRSKANLGGSVKGAFWDLEDAKENGGSSFIGWRLKKSQVALSLDADDLH